MITIKQAMKETDFSRSYIMMLIRKGRIAYATNDTNTVYIVSLDDLLYVKEQVRLRKLTPEKLELAKQTYLLKELGVPQAQINKINMIKVAKSTKVIK